MAQKLLTTAPKREAILAFAAYLEDEKLYLCARDPLTGDYAPAPVEISALIDACHGIDRAQLADERSAALAVETCPCG